MTTFPVQLSVVNQGWAKLALIESASRSACLARARYTPKNLTYETVVRLRDGKWSVVTTLDNVKVTDDYPRARGYEIAVGVINWWMDKYHQRVAQMLPADLVNVRATWLNRATHKLLTDVGDLPEQIGALHILAANYKVSVGFPAAPVTMKGATWATAAHRNLERDLPVEYHRATVALLVDLITGYRDPDDEEEVALTPHKENRMGRVIYEERAWTVRRQASVAVGARAEGEAPPVPPQSGIAISSDKKDRYFLPMSGDKLPTDAELTQLDLGTFISWLTQARERV